MAKQGVDLNKLKSEIETRKKERNAPPSHLGESVGRGGNPRDVFLNGLIESLQTGRETAASSLIKTVENTAAERKGETPKLSAPKIPPVPQQQQRTVVMEDVSPERDEQLFRDLEAKRKQTITESMQGYIQGAQPVSQQRPVGNLNEGYLVENVKKIVDGYLVENFGMIVEEAIKDTILEMYAVERIKEVLQENKELIKSVVIDVIREIKAKSNSKAQ